jgi:hypothetical protein
LGKRRDVRVAGMTCEHGIELVCGYRMVQDGSHDDALDERHGVSYYQLLSEIISQLRPGQVGGHLQRVEISRVPHCQERLEQLVQHPHVGMPV